jgi:glycosyltransferase involved in cell wall biosynthesis
MVGVEAETAGMTTGNGQPGGLADITLLATADWDHPLWTNKQHVACSLAKLGHRVLYVESLGLRPLRAGRSDWRRVLQRLRHGLRPPRPVRERLWVWSPLVLPGARSGPAAWLNRQVLRLGLARCRRRLGLRRDWLWTYNPRTLDVLDAGPYQRLIYHCVDAIQAQPDMPAAAIDRGEARLCAEADAVFVTSPQLLSDLRPLNPQTIYYPNVADGAHFARALDPSLGVPAELAALPAPRIGFVGAISAYKLDLLLLETLARRHPHWSFVLIGPVGEGDPSTDVAALATLDNVHLLGTRPYNDLPAYLKGLDLGLLPLRLSPYTQAMFPMKFFEYLAAGLPVVATAIDALEPFGHLALLRQPTAEAFAAAISAALEGDGPTQQQRLAGAAAHTYRGRTEAMLQDLSQLV